MSGSPLRQALGCPDRDPDAAEAPRALDPIGVVLAGGRGRRLGGRGKATLPLAGAPLAQRAVATLSAVVDDVVVVAKRDTPLPALAVPVWHEPDEPRHPLCGLVHALERSGQRPILVCAVDLPLVGAAELAALADTQADGASCVLAAADRDPLALQPLLGRYEPSALDALRDALARCAPMRALARNLRARALAVDPVVLLNVNTPADLEAAAAALPARGLAQPPLQARSLAQPPIADMDRAG